MTETQNIADRFSTIHKLA